MLVLFCGRVLSGKFYPIITAGQFYYQTINISGPVDSDNTYDITIPEHGGEPPRSFTGALYNVSWTFDRIHCIYAGNSQGGPEIRDMMDSVIAGVYWDYAVNDLFSEDGYKFGLFRSDLC